MRRQPTAEQKAKAAERRERFKALAEKLAGMSNEERAEVAARLPGLSTIEGKALSPGNCCLIFMQGGAAATLVGGFQQWLKHGRAVKKGQHGFMIWVPTFAKADADNPDGQGEKTGYVMGTVFDVAQTEPAKQAAELAVCARM